MCLVRTETNVANLSCFTDFFAVQQYLEVMDEKLHLGIPNYLLAVLFRKIFSDISDAAFGALCGTKYKGNSKFIFFVSTKRSKLIEPHASQEELQK